MPSLIGDGRIHFFRPYHHWFVVCTLNLFIRVVNGYANNVHFKYLSAGFEFPKANVAIDFYAYRICALDGSGR